MNLEFKQSSRIKLDHCPCVIESLDDSNAYVVGTYELDENGAAQEDSSHDNNRKGSLGLIRNAKLITEQNCHDGGVFDLKVFERIVITAHANGNLCSYKQKDDAFELISSFHTGSNMLTSIDYVSFDDNVLIAASDANGFAFTLLSNKELHLNLIETHSNIKLSTTGDPVWRIKLLHVFSDECVLISGSDDCNLRINSVKGVKIGEVPMCIRKDAGAGVTSLEVIRSETPNEYMLLCGSYDENLRIYKMKIALGQVDLSLQKKILIPDAGIWKTRSFEGLRLVAGMYAGAIITNSADEEIVSVLSKFDDGDSNHTNQQDLIYDTVVDKSFTRILVASFYKKVIYVFENA